MCKPNSEIHFCTCISVKKKTFPEIKKERPNLEEYEKKNFIWTLYRYMGEKESSTVGEMVMPVEDIDDQLSAGKILHQLNSKKPFDFKYTPSEGDNLQIRQEYVYKSIRAISRPDLYDYMSFIYRNGTWKEEIYNVFTDKIRKFKTGKIKNTP